MISPEDNLIDEAGMLLHEKRVKASQNERDGLCAVLFTKDEFSKVKDAFFALASKLKHLRESTSKTMDISRVRAAKNELNFLAGTRKDEEMQDRIHRVDEGITELERENESLRNQLQAAKSSTPPRDAIDALKVIESNTTLMIRDWNGIKDSPGLIYRINDLLILAKKGLAALGQTESQLLSDETPTNVEQSPRAEFKEDDESMTPESIRKAMDDEDEDYRAACKTFTEEAVEQMEIRLKAFEFITENSIMITFRDSRIFTSVGTGFMSSLPVGAQVSIRTHDVEVHYDPTNGAF